MKIITLIFLTFISFKGLSCSCLPPGQIDEHKVQKYDLILKGTITKTIHGEWTDTIFINPQRIYKGNLKEETVVITTPSQSSHCGLSLQIDETWLIFATRRGKTLFTNLCTRTKRMRSQAGNYDQINIKNDLMFLEERLKKKQSGINSN